MASNYLAVFIVSTILAVSHGDPASDQLETFKNLTRNQPRIILTSSNGAPTPPCETTTSLNSNIIRNRYLTESLMHLDRERIPERVVHAKGAGAFGYFEVTKNISYLSKAKFLESVGKKTPVAVRFSLVAANLGGADTARDTRGFAIKFYTEEGNFDMVGLNINVFPIKDPLFFSTFAHSQKRNPATNLPDKNMVWDFITTRTESINAFLRVFSDYGTPSGWQYVPGFSIHTYEVVNNEGEHHFIRFHLEPDQGIRNFNALEAQRIAGADPDYLTRSLYNAIASGDPPSWTVKLQILTIEDVQNAEFDPFDTTKELPIDEYPLHTIGRLVLNKNPENFFAQVEQIAFCPSNLVPGILGAPDKLFESRQFSYRDSQNYRLGANFDKIDVNYPSNTIEKVATYDRDGRPPTRDDGRDTPNYYPNSFNGPEPRIEGSTSQILTIIQDESLNYAQASDYYSNQLTSEEQTNLVGNIVESLGEAADFLQERALRLFNEVNTDLAKRVKDTLETSQVL